MIIDSQSLHYLYVPHALHVGQVTYMFPMHVLHMDKGGTGDLYVPHVLHMGNFAVLSIIL